MALDIFKKVNRLHLGYMSKIKYLYPLLNCAGLVTLMCFHVLGQDQLGVNPPALKWSLMETPGGKIVYPRGMHETALDLAYRINSAYLFDTAEVLNDISGRPITTIIQNQSVFPAGFATTVPWRQELFLTPPQNLFMGPSIWKDAVTTHEYRHAQQFMAYDKGLTKFYKGLMGNTGWLLSTVLNVPLWFREGDAVDSETRYTVGGRGSLPAFHMEYRTLRLNEIQYHYEKAMSPVNFRDFVPNIYRSGYYMTRQLRSRHGGDFWAQIIDRSTEKLFYPFSRALKNSIGVKTPELYHATFQRMDSIWVQSDTVQNLIGQRISKDPKTFEHYRFPQIDKNGNIIVSHRSFTDIRGFYQLRSDSTLKKITSAGIYTSDHYNFVVEGHLLAWAEAAYNPRYANKTYSVVKVRNLETGITRKIGRLSKYFSPTPSPDGRKIAVVEFDEFENCSLRILDIDHGNPIESFTFANDLLAQPRWITSNELVMVVINRDGNALVKLDIEKNEWTTLLKAYNINISKPFFYQGKVYFSSGLTGIENIFSLDFAEQEIKQITNARFGAFDPHVYNDTLYFSNYDRNGYEIWRVPLVDALDKSVEFPTRLVNHSLPGYYKDVVKDYIQSEVTIDSVYRSFFWQSFFRPIGWFPLVFPPALGMEFNTLNLERTFRTSIGVNYNLDEDILQTRFVASYAKYFPIVHATLLQRGRRMEQSLAVYSDEDLPERRLRERILGMGVEIPLNLTQGVYNTSLRMQGDFSHHKIDDLDREEVSQEFNAIIGTVGFSRVRAKARRQVQSPFGQILQGAFSSGLESGDPRQLNAEGLFFFPGAWRTHSLNARMVYERNENISLYRYLQRHHRSRGYDRYPFEDFYLISANYELPVFYPDVYLPGILGVTRLRLNLFADYAVGNTMEFEQRQRSVGAECVFDLRLFRAFNMQLNLQFINRLDVVGLQQPFVFNVTVPYFELLN